MKIQDECTFYWWDKCVGLEVPNKENKDLLMYFDDGRGRCSLLLDVMERKYGPPGSTCILGLNTIAMSLWMKTAIAKDPGEVYQRNVIYDLLCCGDDWFAKRSCPTTLIRLRKLVQDYKLREECQSRVYIWTEGIPCVSLELSNYYFHFRPALNSPTMFKNFKMIGRLLPTTICTSKQQDIQVRGNPTGSVNVGILGEQNVMNACEQFKKNKPHWYSNLDNCQFVIDRLCDGSEWYKEKFGERKSATVQDIHVCSIRRQACQLFLWQLKKGRTHLALRLPNGEYISVSPDGWKIALSKFERIKVYQSYTSETRDKNDANRKFKMEHTYFDIKEMTDKWFELLEKKKPWHLLYNNCSDVVYEILCAGSNKFRDEINGVKTPANVMELAMAIDEDNTNSYVDQSEYILPYVFFVVVCLCCIIMSGLVSIYEDFFS